MRSTHLLRFAPTAPRYVSIVLILLATASTSFAQSKVGGHFGMVTPLVQLAAGDVSIAADGLGLGFPMGLNLGVKPGVAFDLELVPFIQDNQVSNVLIHPGALMALTNGYTFGLRAAFETGGAYGVTALLNKGKRISKDVTLFAEFVVPIRFFREAPQFEGEVTDVRKAIAGALHVGIGF
ncbi:MAG: hypothetical protein R2834_00580 [Rhodothermales bacterium]